MPRKTAAYKNWNPRGLRILYQKGKDNLTASDIAEHFGVSENTVRRGLKYFKIKKSQFPLVPLKEDDIREQLFGTIARMPRSLAYKLPVGQVESDLWIINGYTSTDNKRPDYPLEIHIRFNYDTGTWDVDKFEFRGKSEKFNSDRLTFQRKLNESL